MPNIRCFNMRPYEVRRLLEVGSVRVVRPVKPQPPNDPRIGMVNASYCGHPKLWLCDGNVAKCRDVIGVTQWLCPFGAPGDTVRVREAFSLSTETMGLGGGYTSIDPRKYTGIRVWYRADNNRPTWAEVKWRSPATMPAWASRLSAVVDDVRACRVQEVTEAEAIEAGVMEWRAWWTRAQAAEAFLCASIAKAATNDGPVANWLFYMMHDKYTRDPAAKYESNPWCWNALITRSDK